jgi:hypothetical protein
VLDRHLVSPTEKVTGRKPAHALQFQVTNKVVAAGVLALFRLSYNPLTLLNASQAGGIRTHDLSLSRS